MASVILQMCIFVESNGMDVDSLNFYFQLRVIKSYVFVFWPRYSSQLACLY